AQEFNRVVGCDGAGRCRQTVALHQVIGGRPIRMTIEQRADDAATQDAGESLMISFGLPLGDHLSAAREAAYVQALRVRRPATETNHLRRVMLLQTLLHHLSSSCAKVYDDLVPAS